MILQRQDFVSNVFTFTMTMVVDQIVVKTAEICKSAFNSLPAIAKRENLKLRYNVTLTWLF